MAYHLPMVIDHNHRFTGLIQLLGFQEMLDMGIHDNEQCLFGHRFHYFFRLCKHISAALFDHPVNERGGQGFLPMNSHHRSFSHIADDTA